MDAIICEGCFKEYKWNARYAGRKVKCKCGQVMVMPDLDPQSLDPLTTDPLIAVAALPIENEGVQPSEGAQVAGAAGAYDIEIDTTPAPTSGSGAGAGINRSLHVRSQPRPGLTPPMRRVSEVALGDPDSEVSHQLREWYLPMGVLVAGVLIQLIVHISSSDSAIEGAIGWVILLLVELFVFSPLAIVSMFLVAKFKEMSFGPLLPGIFKMTAVTVGAGGLADLFFLNVVDYLPNSTRVVFLVLFLINLVFLGVPAAILFRLETGETSALVGTIITTRFVLIILILMMFM